MFELVVLLLAGHNVYIYLCKYICFPEHNNEKAVTLPNKYSFDNILPPPPANAGNWVVHNNHIDNIIYMKQFW